MPGPDAVSGALTKDPAPARLVAQRPVSAADRASRCRVALHLTLTGVDGAVHVRVDPDVWVPVSPRWLHQLQVTSRRWARMSVHAPSVHAGRVEAAQALVATFADRDPLPGAVSLLNATDPEAISVLEIALSAEAGPSEAMLPTPATHSCALAQFDRYAYDALEDCSRLICFDHRTASAGDVLVGAMTCAGQLGNLRVLVRLTTPIAERLLVLLPQAEEVIDTLSLCPRPDR